MELQGAFKLSEFIEWSRFRKEIIEDICLKWPKLNGFSTYIDEGSLSISNNQNGSISIGIGYDEYLIAFDEIYTQGPGINNDLSLKLFFYKQTFEKNNRNVSYVLLNDQFYIDRNTSIFEGNDRVYVKNFMHEYYQVLFSIFGTIAMTSSNFLKDSV